MKKFIEFGHVRFVIEKFFLNSQKINRNFKILEKDFHKMGEKVLLTISKNNFKNFRKCSFNNIQRNRNIFLEKLKNFQKMFLRNFLERISKKF